MTGDDGMTLDQLGLFLALVLPAASYCVASLWLLRDIKRTNDQLLEMHRNADEEGFGTVGLTHNQETLTRNLKDLVFYVRWAVKEMTGKEPPARPPDV